MWTNRVSALLKFNGLPSELADGFGFTFGNWLWKAVAITRDAAVEPPNKDHVGANTTITSEGFEVTRPRKLVWQAFCSQARCFSTSPRRWLSLDTLVVWAAPLCTKNCRPADSSGGSDRNGPNAGATAAMVGTAPRFIHPSPARHGGLHAFHVFHASMRQGRRLSAPSYSISLHLVGDGTEKEGERMVTTQIDCFIDFHFVGFPILSISSHAICLYIYTYVLFFFFESRNGRASLMIWLCLTYHGITLGCGTRMCEREREITGKERTDSE